MYYNISPEYIIESMDIATRRRITGTLGNVPFTGADIIRETFEASNRCAEESNMVVGGVYIGELYLTFKPSFLSKVPRKKFVGKEIHVNIGLKVGNAWEDVPIGAYIIQTAKISKDGIAIEAYDYMSKFDKPFPFDESYGTIYQLLSFCCTQCGVVLGVTQSFCESLPNGQDELYLIQENDIETYRDFLYWIAQTCCCFATMDRDGRLEIRPYTGYGTTELDTEHRDVDAVFSDYTTNWTAIGMDDKASGEEQIYSKTPNNGLTMHLGANPLLQTVADEGIMSAIAYLEGEIQRIEGLINTAEQEKEGLEDELQYVQDQLIDHPDDPDLLAREAYLENAIEEVGSLIEQYGKDVEKLEKELADVRSGQEKASKVFRDKARKNILDAVALIHFSPFTVFSARDPIYELGDEIYFEGGLGNDENGLIMYYSYKVDTFTFEGYGDDPTLTDSRSGADKSFTSIKKSQKDESRVEFAYFVNSSEINVTEGQSKEVGHVRFGLKTTGSVEAWVEIKLKSEYNADHKAGIKITYYLDGEEMVDYHPIDEWSSYGSSTDFTLDGNVLVFSTSRPESTDNMHTVNYHYHLMNVDATDYHIWRVYVESLDGTQKIEIGDAHIVLFAEGLLSDSEWMGLIECSDEFPVYDIGTLELFGTLTEEATITTSTPSNNVRITESGDRRVTEDGDVRVEE